MTQQHENDQIKHCSKIRKFRGDYGFLSNPYRRAIQYDNRVWPSSEHLFQASKTCNFNEQEAIRNEDDLKKVKKLGREATCRSDWDEVKIRVMYDCLRLKFSQHIDLLEKLIATYPHLLIEGNYWHDNFWGDCWCKKCENKKGLNFLGMLLMKLRIEKLIDRKRGKL